MPFALKVAGLESAAAWLVSAAGPLDAGAGFAVGCPWHAATKVTPRPASATLRTRNAMLLPPRFRDEAFKRNPPRRHYKCDRLTSDKLRTSLLIRRDHAGLITPALCRTDNAGPQAGCGRAMTPGNQPKAGASEVYSWTDPRSPFSERPRHLSASCWNGSCASRALARKAIISIRRSNRQYPGTASSCDTARRPIEC